MSRSQRAGYATEQLLAPRLGLSGAAAGTQLPRLRVPWPRVGHPFPVPFGVLGGPAGRWVLRGHHLGDGQAVGHVGPVGVVVRAHRLVAERGGHREVSGLVPHLGRVGQLAVLAVVLLHDHAPVVGDRRVGQVGAGEVRAVEADTLEAGGGQRRGNGALLGGGQVRAVEHASDHECPVQLRALHAGVGEVRVGQIGVGEISLLQARGGPGLQDVAADQRRAGEDHAVQAGLGEVAVADEGEGEVGGLAELDAAQGCGPEAGLVEHGAVERRADQPGLAEVHFPAQAGAGEIRPVQRGVAEVGLIQGAAAEVGVGPPHAAGVQPGQVGGWYAGDRGPGQVQARPVQSDNRIGQRAVHEDCRLGRVGGLG